MHRFSKPLAHSAHANRQRTGIAMRRMRARSHISTARGIVPRRASDNVQRIIDRSLHDLPPPPCRTTITSPTHGVCVRTMIRRYVWCAPRSTHGNTIGPSSPSMQRRAINATPCTPTQRALNRGLKTPIDILVFPSATPADASGACSGEKKRSTSAHGLIAGRGMHLGARRLGASIQRAEQISAQNGFCSHNSTHVHRCTQFGQTSVRNDGTPLYCGSIARP